MALRCLSSSMFGYRLLPRGGERRSWAGPGGGRGCGRGGGQPGGGVEVPGLVRFGGFLVWVWRQCSAGMRNAPRFKRGSAGAAKKSMSRLESITVRLCGSCLASSAGGSGSVAAMYRRSELRACMPGQGFRRVAVGDDHHVAGTRRSPAVLVEHRHTSPGARQRQGGAQTGVARPDDDRIAGGRERATASRRAARRATSRARS